MCLSSDLYYFYLPPQELEDGRDVPYIRYMLYLIAGHVFALCAPFIMSWNDGSYFNYLKNVILAVARSLLFSGVLYLGLVLAIVAMEFLFEIDFNSARYGQLFVFCLGIVNTWVYLSDFPRDIQFNLRFAFNNATGVFVKFILIPLTALYSIILYAYAVKILVRWELPEGWVSYLITALSALIFLIQFIVHPVRHTHESRLIRKFSPLCYWVLLPLLPLLYTAIFRRVNDYGVTENRYFLILLAVFITGAAVYLLWSRKKQLRFLPIALLVLILLSSVGPRGAFSVSAESQLNQMNEVFQAFPPTGGQGAPARRLGGKAKEEQNQRPSDIATITKEQSYRFGSITRYLYDRGKLSEAKGFLGYDPVKKFEKVNAYSISASIIDQMGLKVPSGNDYRDAYLNYYADQKEPIRIAGFELMREVDIQSTRKKSIPISRGYALRYDSDSNALELIKDGENGLSIPLYKLAKRLKKHNRNNFSQVDNLEMKLDAEDENVKVRILFKNISFEKGDKDDDDKTKFRNANLILLLKIKNNAQ